MDNNDILMRIAYDLELDDLINYCLVSKNFNKAVCENKYFWLQRLKNEPDRNISILIGFSYKNKGRGSGDHVLHLSKYIPNRDVITIIQTITDRFLISQGVNSDMVNHYEVKINNKWQCRTNTLTRACFSEFNRNTQEVIVYVYLNEKIETEHYMELRKTLNIISRDVINEYKKSLMGTPKEYLIQYL